MQTTTKNKRKCQSEHAFVGAEWTVEHAAPGYFVLMCRKDADILNNVDFFFLLLFSHDVKREQSFVHGTVLLKKKNYFKRSHCALSNSIEC